MKFIMKIQLNKLNNLKNDNKHIENKLKIKIK